jgi:glutathione peroxidase
MINKIILSLAVAVPATLAGQSLYDFSAVDIDGNNVPLSRWQGKPLLIVNTASKCGFTPQYEGLEKLYAAYKERGFVILAFPANDFFGQEPGSDQQIKEFCSLTYNTSFPLFSKIVVRGKGQHPLYAWLTDRKIHPKTGGHISWNFNKFLVDKTGQVAARFDSKVEPMDAAIVAALEKTL